MLKITIPPGESYNERTNKFINTKECELVLEHSLVSISKWESKYHKPFISKEQKTNEELIDYIKFMTITQNVDDNIYLFLTPAHYKLINEYIDNSMTATVFTSLNQTNPQMSNSHKQSFITNELIYYWMISYQIPFECQRWHLNRLLTLIRVCNIKNDTNNKMSKKDIYANNKALNAARRAKNHSKG